MHAKMIHLPRKQSLLLSFDTSVRREGGQSQL